MAQLPVGRLHVLTDTVVQQAHSHAQLAQMAIQAGVPVVQYREKNKTEAALLAQTKALVALTHGTNTKLIVNDHLAVAVAAGAHGVHVGQGDAPPQTALAHMPPGSIVGATVHNLAELEAVQGLPIAYIGVGPVFGTASKHTGLPPLGTAMLAKFVTLSAVPVIAIGAIHLNNVREVLDCGVHGIAVLSSFCCAPNPVHAAQNFLDILASYPAAFPS